MKKQYVIGLIFVLLSAVVFGFTPVLAGLSYQGGNNGVNMSFLRSVLPLPVLFFLGFRSGGMPTRSQCKRGAVIGLLQFGCTLMLYSSYSYLSVGVATTLHFLYPLFVVGWGIVVEHQKASPMKLAGLFVGMAGAASLIELGEGGMSPFGVALALLSGVVFAAYIIAVKREGAAQPMPLYQLMVVLSLAGAALCGAVGLGLNQLTFNLTPAAWGYAIACAFLVSLGGSVLFQAGIRRVGDADASIYSLLEPLSSIVFGIWLMGEEITARKGISCLLIFAGLLLTALDTRRRT